MARKATGAVISHVGTDGRTFRSLRFTAYGKRRFLSLGPVSAEATPLHARRHRTGPLAAAADRRGPPSPSPSRCQASTPSLRVVDPE